jgi:hypothetical protein
MMPTAIGTDHHRLVETWLFFSSKTRIARSFDGYNLGKGKIYSFVFANR